MLLTKKRPGRQVVAYNTIQKIYNTHNVSWHNWRRGQIGNKRLKKLKGNSKIKCFKITFERTD